jgi:hypothetical protein
MTLTVSFPLNGTGASPRILFHVIIIIILILILILLLIQIP